MGSSHSILRLDTLLLLFCGANLAGLPFTIGYVYKFFFFKLLISGVFNYIIVGNLLVGMLSSLVYFFRLIFYVTFDFYKGVKATPYYFLLVVKQNAVDQVKLTTFNHVLAVCILLVSSFATAVFFN
jgi:formate hydrogenlyase subunit 3/multisubunit Na+/H+ antiporter MnhD subunit